MDVEKLVPYIRTQIEGGVSREKIKIGIVKNSDWTEDDVNKVFDIIDGVKISATNDKEDVFKNLIKALVVVIFVIGGVYFFEKNSSDNKNHVFSTTFEKGTRIETDAFVITLPKSFDDLPKIPGLEENVVKSGAKYVDGCWVDSNSEAVDVDLTCLRKGVTNEVVFSLSRIRSKAIMDKATQKKYFEMSSKLIEGEKELGKFMGYQSVKITHDDTTLIVFIRNDGEYDRIYQVSFSGDVSDAVTLWPDIQQAMQTVEFKD